MSFLIDENLPPTLGHVFSKRGFIVECVLDLPQLRGSPDEVIFEYAIKHRMIIVTRDLGFANPLRFNLAQLQGLVIIRFPNEISIKVLCEEIVQLLQDMPKERFHNLIVLEPGSIRVREL